jgi:membrane associated rhomboid family serine protease
MRKKLAVPLSFTTLMWLLFIAGERWNANLVYFGIWPRHVSSLPAILTSPLIHANWEHLLSNTIPMLILGIILFITYEKIAAVIWIANYLLTGTLVWLFARASYHIGASGIIYGLASFLLFSGFFRMDIKSIAIASGVALFYGSLVWGVLPIQPGVSWESHLFGGITGMLLAFIFRNHCDEAAQEQKETDSRKTFERFLDR